MVAAGFGMSRDGIEDDAISDTMRETARDTTCDTTRDSVRTGRGAEEYLARPVR